MPSDRETQSKTWGMASDQWDVIRSAAGWSSDQGRVSEAEELMARLLEVQHELLHLPVVRDFKQSKTGRALLGMQARRRGSSGRWAG